MEFMIHVWLVARAGLVPEPCPLVQKRLLFNAFATRYAYWRNEAGGGIQRARRARCISYFLPGASLCPCPMPAEASYADTTGSTDAPHTKFTGASAEKPPSSA